MSNSSVSQELHRRFGAANDPEALFRIGPFSNLVGRRVAELSFGTHAPLEIAVMRPESVSMQVREDLVPCYFEGRIVAPRMPEEPIALAIAVNGIIRATTRTYRLGRFRDRFAAMAFEGAFHEGPNDVQYFSVSGTASDLHLTACEVRAGVSE